MRLENKLNQLNRYPFHMPGHKRNPKFNLPSQAIDITEIDGFDNLHNAKGILKELEDEFSDIFDSKRSFALVNGSTCGILAAIFALCNKHDEIIIARNCHKSVYNACLLRELKVYYIYPESSDFGCCAVTQANVDAAVNKHPNAKAVVITSPTYEGAVSRVTCSLPLIIDSAHGAHFGFGKVMPKRQYGDIIIQSLHKTLPSLTQTAVIHVNRSKYIDGVKKYIDIFETSSPSYILLSSISQCALYLKNSKTDFAIYENRLFDIYKTLENCRNLTHCKSAPDCEHDISRIVVGSVKDISGAELAKILRSEYNIEPEMASANYIVLITTVADTADGFNMLKKALLGIDKTLNSYSGKSDVYASSAPVCKKTSEAYEINNTHPVRLQEAQNKICGEYIYAYPPGIPIIVPGEIIDKSITDYITQLSRHGVNILSDSNLLPLEILTKTDV